MQFIEDFLRKKVPHASGEIPVYYRHALYTSEALLGLYFLLNIGLFYWGAHQLEWMPIVMLLMTLVGLWSIGRTPLRLNLGIYTVITAVWCGWYVRTCGWSCGGQHFLVPLIILMFFNIYDPPLLKIAYFVVALTYRMALFTYAISTTPVITLENSVAIVFQTVNSLVFFLMMALLCILFSSNIQETERKLRLDNQELHKEAGTDPLTQLPNRRQLLDEIDHFHRLNSQETFSVAIADIDFFKRVNDTYGHNCGDYTLRTLADLFKSQANDRYTVCRWGGEEFCFFMPGRNLGEAGSVMMDICLSVRRMELAFEDYRFNITITIGVEENDFFSPLDTILEKADQKLYMGKNSGRDRVVV